MKDDKNQSTEEFLVGLNASVLRNKAFLVELKAHMDANTRWENGLAVAGFAIAIITGLVACSNLYPEWFPEQLNAILSLMPPA